MCLLTQELTQQRCKSFFSHTQSVSSVEEIVVWGKIQNVVVDVENWLEFHYHSFRAINSGYFLCLAIIHEGTVLLFSLPSIPLLSPYHICWHLLVGGIAFPSLAITLVSCWLWKRATTDVFAASTLDSYRCCSYKSLWPISPCRAGARPGCGVVGKWGLEGSGTETKPQVVLLSASKAFKCLWIIILKKCRNA